MHTSNIDPKQIGYSWVPPGIVTSSKVIEKWTYVQYENSNVMENEILIEILFILFLDTKIF